MELNKEKSVLTRRDRLGGWTGVVKWQQLEALEGWKSTQYVKAECYYP